MKLVKTKSQSAFEKDTIKKISEKFNLYPEIIEILFMRNIDDENKIEQYLHPSLKDFYDPFLLHGMAEAVERIQVALDEKQNVLIFGDYDVDGVSATAILVKYFNQKGLTVRHFMPNRYVDGYGLSCEAIDKIVAEGKPDLIITVDCGISCHDEVEYAKSLGIDVIVTDHHDIPDILPECITVNAKLPNQPYPFMEICGTGMAFKVVQAIEGIEYAQQFLPICAIATIADIVPLLYENRAMVTLGLKMMDKAPKGILRLMKRLDIRTPQATDISYKLAPKLNASGRMGDADKSFELYMCEDDQRIEELIDLILDFNTKRQDLCNVVYEDCKKILDTMSLTNQRAICLYSADWDSGILGIVAARLCEEYYRPTFLFSLVDGVLSGSGRSIEGVNIHSCLKQTQDILESFGGHTMAAGLKLKEEHFESFCLNMQKILEKDFDSYLFVPQKTFDLDLDLSKVTKEFVRQLNVLEPVGSDNPRPRFRIKFARANAILMKQYPNHLTMNLNNINAVGFNFGKYKDLMNAINTKKAIVELHLDVYKGHETSKMFLKQVVADKNMHFNDKHKILGEYFSQILCKDDNDCKFNMINASEIDSLLNSVDEVFGTLLVVNSIETYNKYLYSNIASKISSFNHKIIYEDKGHNTLILNPSLNNNFRNFSKIIFLDPILNFGYIKTLSNLTNADIYIYDNDLKLKKFADKLSTEREICANYYKGISKTLVKHQKFNSLSDFYYSIRNNVQNCSYLQMIFCLKIFSEIGILNYNFEDGILRISENKNIHSNLENSKTYSTISTLQTKKNFN